MSACADQQTNNMQNSRVEQLPYYNEASFTPKWFPEGNVPAGFHQIPDFNLINQEGDHVSQKTLAGKIYIADFFFTSCPGICPKMTESMSLLQEEFSDDSSVFLLSHSVTPLKDSVSVLSSYADLHGVDADKWYLLTGNRHEIYELGRKAYFIEEDLGITKSEEDFLHTENFVLIDKNRRIRGIYNSLNLISMKQLIADVRTLMEEV